MFGNYFKTAWRNILKNKGYSALNVLGLSLGMAVALLIGLWVQFQYSYNKFLPGYEQLYRVARNFNSNGQILTFRTTSLKLAEALRTEIPGIARVAESDWMGSHGLMVGDRKLYLDGGQTGSDFLKMFRFPLLEGRANEVLKDPYSIVLTQSVAKALFGDREAIGQTVRFDNKNDLKVTGILGDLPVNSTFHFHFLVPFSYLEQTSANVRGDRTGSFGNNNYQQFVQLKPGLSYAQVAPKIKNIEKTETDNTNAMRSEVILEPMKDWRLYSDYKNGKASGGLIDYMHLFSIIGILVVLIACINFINLATARSEKRAREVGVRKAIGSRRRDLVFQFLLESFILVLVAFAFALLLVRLSLPAFNAILTQSMIVVPYSSGSFWLLLAGGILVTALAAGSRPAFYLSSFQPVRVLKGSPAAGKSAALSRKILVVLQFSCSIALIISTLIIYRQVRYGKDRSAGYDVNRLLMTDMNRDLARHYTALKNDLLQNQIAASVSTATSPATGIYWHSDVDQWPGKNAGETVEMGIDIVSDDYFKTLGMTMQAGRDFDSPADTTNVIFNEAAIKRLRLKRPVGQTITFQGSRYRIIGVVKDALMVSPFAPADPTMFLHDHAPQNVMFYRLSPGIKTREAITRLTALFNKYDPAYPFSYQFADQEYAAKFTLVEFIGKLSGLFATLAILISCLGLFGLAAFIAEQRTKEIGIRKVLGASISQMWLLLSKDFLLLVIISCMIASPLAFYFLQRWLQQYSYRISIGPGVFVIAAVSAIVITVLTVGFQAIRAAMANPVNSLKTE